MRALPWRSGPRMALVWLVWEESRRRPYAARPHLQPPQQACDLVAAPRPARTRHQLQRLRRRQPHIRGGLSAGQPWGPPAQNTVFHGCVAPSECAASDWATPGAVARLILPTKLETAKVRTVTGRVITEPAPKEIDSSMKTRYLVRLAQSYRQRFPLFGGNTTHRKVLPKAHAYVSARKRGRGRGRSCSGSLARRSSAGWRSHLPTEFCTKSRIPG